MENGWFVVVLVAVMVVVVIGRRAAGADVSAARAKIAGGARVIDVRTPGEYASGHYDGAMNIPLGELQARASGLGGRADAMVVYCASGVRSARAARILRAAGYTDVTDAGGLANIR